MWRPNTLLEAINSGETITLRQKQGGRYVCPNCRVHRHPAVIVDVRHLPIPEEWACDCCWTRWMREQHVIDGGPPLPALDLMGNDRNVRLAKQLAKEREWKRRWVVAHNAPAEVVQKFVSDS